jgi:hypothetical protein
MAVTVIKTYSRKIAAPKKSKTGLIVGISLIILASGLGMYFWYKNKKAKDAILPNGTPSVDTSVIDTKQTTSSTSSPIVETSITTNTNPVAVMSNEPKDTLSFQKWCNKNKGTTLKEDGIYGSKTKAEWNKFGLEYTNLTSQKIQDLNAYLKANKNAIGKVIYTKYAGADVFDGVVADNVFNKITTIDKVMAVGKVAKVIPTTTGYWVVFSGSQNKFYKMYSSNLNILA